MKTPRKKRLSLIDGVIPEEFTIGQKEKTTKLTSTEDSLRINRPLNVDGNITASDATEPQHVVVKKQFDEESQDRYLAEKELEQKIRDEATARESGDLFLDDKIDKESARAKAAEDKLSSDLDSESATARRAESKLASDLAQETLRAKAYEGKISGDLDRVADKLDDEISRAKSSEGILSDRLDEEARSRSDEDSLIRDEIHSQSLSAELARDDLKKSIEDEAKARKKSDDDLSLRVTANQNMINAETTARVNQDKFLNDYMVAERADRQDEDQRIRDQISQNEQDREDQETQIRSALADEVAARKSADDEISAYIGTKEDDSTKETVQGRIKKVEEDLATENAGRVSEVSRLDKRIDDEATARTNSDNSLDDKIDKEIADRTSEVARLDKRVDDEISDRTNDELAISGRIDDEVQDRTDADNALGARIDAEASTRDAEDKILDKKIDDEIKKLSDSTDTAVGDLDTKKLDKVTTSGTTRVYSISEQGAQQELDVSKGKDNDTIVQRTSTGTIIASDATTDSEVVTKKQLDKVNSDLDTRVTQAESDIDTLESTTLKNSGKQKLDGSLEVTGDLTVKGLTVTEGTKTLEVQNNMIVTNSDGAPVLTHLSGLAIRKDASQSYGIAYDPSDNSVKLGLGILDANSEFDFNDGEGLPIVVRDSLQDGHLVKWSQSGYKIVDTGKSLDDLVQIAGNQSISGIKEFTEKVSAEELEATKSGSKYKFDPSLRKITLDQNGDTPTSHDFLFPSKSGTFALTSDVSDLETKVNGYKSSLESSISAEATARESGDDALEGRIDELRGDISSVGFSGSYSDLKNIPTEFTPSAHTHEYILSDDLYADEKYKLEFVATGDTAGTPDSLKDTRSALKISRLYRDGVADTYYLGLKRDKSVEITLPDVSGQLVVKSDLEKVTIDESGLVHKAQDETITGKKKFTSLIESSTDSYINLNDEDYVEIGVGPNNSLLIPTNVNDSNKRITWVTGEEYRSLAYTTDFSISDEGLVHKGLSEEITGEKTFVNVPLVVKDAGAFITGGNKTRYFSDYISLTKESDSTSYSYRFPQKSGTFALLSDIAEETDPTVPAWAKAPTKPVYTKEEIGLGNVDNTSDVDKPVSTAQQTALDNLQSTLSGLLSAHISNKSNPHGVTIQQIGAASASHTHSNSSDIGGPYALQSHTHSYVPTSRTVNGKALSSNISLTASDVGASPTDHNHDDTYLKLTGGKLSGNLTMGSSSKVIFMENAGSSDLQSGSISANEWSNSRGRNMIISTVSAGKLLVTANGFQFNGSNVLTESRTINGKALSSDITLSASDVGAAPSNYRPLAVYENDNAGPLLFDMSSVTYDQSTRIAVLGPSYNPSAGGYCLRTIPKTTFSLASHTHSNYVPTTRTINGKALSSNVSLTLDDITNKKCPFYMKINGYSGSVLFNIITPPVFVSKVNIFNNIVAGTSGGLASGTSGTLDSSATGPYISAILNKLRGVFGGTAIPVAGNYDNGSSSGAAMIVNSSSDLTIMAVDNPGDSVDISLPNNSNINCTIYFDDI